MTGLTRGNRQVKRSLKTTDKELVRRRLEDVRQKVAKLNTKAGRTATFADRWLGTIGGRLKPSIKLRRQTAVGRLNPFFVGIICVISEAHVKDWASRRTTIAAARTFNSERETLIRNFCTGIRLCSSAVIARRGCDSMRGHSCGANNGHGSHPHGEIVQPSQVVIR